MPTSPFRLKGFPPGSVNNAVCDNTEAMVKKPVSALLFGGNPVSKLTPSTTRRSNGNTPSVRKVALSGGVSNLNPPSAGSPSAPAIPIACGPLLGKPVNGALIRVKLIGVANCGGWPLASLATTLTIRR